MHGETTLAILQRILDFDRNHVSHALAEAVLLIHFAESDQTRMLELVSRCNQGILTADEAEEYDGYIAAADLLSRWQSKARLALKTHAEPHHIHSD